MSKDEDEHVELYRGPKGVVEGVVLANGDCPSCMFLSDLDDQAWAQFRARFERLTTIGYLRNPDQMRDLDVPGTPKVWEIKAPAGPGWRLYLVRAQKIWVATHGTRKPPDRRVPIEVEKARTIFEEWTE